jgi:hypothetical protein
VVPFDAYDKGFSFRFFCGDSIEPTELNVPRSDTRGHVCTRCRARISVEDIGRGPYLIFWSQPEIHCAAGNARKPHSS